MVRQRKPVAGLLLWLFAGLLAVMLAWLLDSRVDAALDVNQNSSLHQFAWWCSRLGEGGSPALAGFFFGILFLLLRRPIVAAQIFFIMITCEFTGLVALLLRIFAGRTRPLADVPQGFYGLWYNSHWIAGKYEFSSFPSGHTATAVGLAAAAWMVHRGWGIVAMFYALLVTWSRIALQCHHLSDVVASIVLAVPLAALSRRVLLAPLEFQFTNLQRAGQKE